MSGPFDQERNVAASASRQVVREGAVIRLVINYSNDHSWAFLDSEYSDSSDWLVVGMGIVAHKDRLARSQASRRAGSQCVTRRVAHGRDSRIRTFDDRSWPLADARAVRMRRRLARSAIDMNRHLLPPMADASTSLAHRRLARMTLTSTIA